MEKQGFDKTTRKEFLQQLAIGAGIYFPGIGTGIYNGENQ